MKVDKNEKLSLMRTFLQSDTAPIFLVFIVFIIVVGFIQPRFLMPMNIRNILIQVSITGMLALGMTLVMLSGGIDLSVGWFVSFVGCAMAYLMVAGLSIPVVVILGIFILYVWGNGIYHIKDQIRTFYCFPRFYDRLSRLYLFDNKRVRNQYWGYV